MKRNQKGADSEKESSSLHCVTNFCGNQVTCEVTLSSLLLWSLNHCDLSALEFLASILANGKEEGSEACVDLSLKSPRNYSKTVAFFHQKFLGFITTSATNVMRKHSFRSGALNFIYCLVAGRKMHR